MGKTRWARLSEGWAPGGGRFGRPVIRCLWRFSGSRGPGVTVPGPLRDIGVLGAGWVVQEEKMESIEHFAKFAVVIAVLFIRKAPKNALLLEGLGALYSTTEPRGRMCLASTVAMTS